MKPQRREAYVPWRDRAFVSLEEAAEIVARSPGWVRRRIIDGHLSGFRLFGGGALLVSVPSLCGYIKAASPVAPADVKAPPTRLALVASNPLK
ncbi:hypothetical protein [Rhizobium sp. PL01]|uniref:hypothetical protein n=1 Tax=Rhizobium sp. PL01 TaxID=3085631 RepID=UPI0029811C15|nr:hypothetical protein [Rhizobium sp. PL01]MDW5315505.1 hypothetical protein [Rhizobium sp. PL01]